MQHATLAVIQVAPAAPANGPMLVQAYPAVPQYHGPFPHYPHAPTQVGPGGGLPRPMVVVGGAKPFAEGAVMDNADTISCCSHVSDLGAGAQPYPAHAHAHTFATSPVYMHPHMAGAAFPQGYAYGPPPPNFAAGPPPGYYTTSAQAMPPQSQPNSEAGVTTAPSHIPPQQDTFTATPIQAATWVQATQNSNSTQA